MAKADTVIELGGKVVYNNPFGNDVTDGVIISVFNDTYISITRFGTLVLHDVNDPNKEQVIHFLKVR